MLVSALNDLVKDAWFMNEAHLIFKFENIVLIILVFLTLLYLFYIWLKDSSLVGNRQISILLFFAVLVPFLEIEISENLPAVRLEMIITVFIWLLLLYDHFIKGKKLRLADFKNNMWFLFFGLSVVLSIAYATFILEHQPIGRDYYELLKLFIYFLIFNLVAGAKITLSELKGIYFFSLAVLLISALFGITQYFNFVNVNEWLSPIFTSDTQMDNLLNLRRITGTVPNPNEFGALMVLASSLAFSGIFTYSNNRERAFCGIAFVIYTLALFLTLSRSSFIAFCIAILFLMVLNYRRFKILFSPRFFVVSGLIIAFIFLVFVYILPEAFFERIGNLFDISQAQSWAERLIRWEANYEIWKGSPFFGWGPSKADMTTLVDNEWLMLLRRYGIIGIVMFIGLISSFYRVLQQGKTNINDEFAVSFTHALMATLSAYLVYMIAVVVYHSLQLMPIFLIMLGIVYAVGRNRENLPEQEII